jgi:hypothetical protein
MTPTDPKRLGRALRWSSGFAAGAVCGLASLLPVRAEAQRAPMVAELTTVPSSFEQKHLFDFRLGVRYDHTEKRAALKRELQQEGQDTTVAYRDLRFASSRDTLAIRADIGLYRNLGLSVELPIVLADQVSYAFDHSAGSSCVFPPLPNPNCVNASNSSTVLDGIVPAAGFDAQAGGMAPGMSQLLRSPVRGARGGGGLDAFDSINLGLTWGILSQAHDPSKPNWTLGFESQVSFGNVMRFDRSKPTDNRGVSEGLHRFIVRTSLSRRFRYVEPYWSLWYQLPVARSDSQFVDYGRPQKVKAPQMRGGLVFGTEIVPYERKEKSARFAIDLRMRLTGNFAGRGYSEAWQLLASSPALDCTPATSEFNPACDSSLVQNPYQNRPFTGLTTIGDYATVGADIGLVGQFGPWFRMRAGFDFTHDQAHRISGDDIGRPEPGSASGRVVEPSEFNPAYRALIDQVGRRYIVDEVTVYNISLTAQALF